MSTTIGVGVGRYRGTFRVWAVAAAMSLVAVTLPSAAGAIPIHEELEGYSCPPERVPSVAFTDVARSQPHATSIACMHWWRVAMGRTDGRFVPGGGVTRAQMASFVHRFLLVSGFTFAPGERLQFDDVDGPHADAIAELAGAGVVRGVGDGRYEPNRYITRAQTASFLRRATELVGGRPLPQERQRFDDVSGVHAGSIEALAAIGVIAGTTPTTFAPGRPVTRGQMASLLARLQGHQVILGYVTAHWWPRLHRPVSGRGIASASALATADLTGDGREELILLGQPSAAQEPRPWSWLFVFGSDGDGDLELLQAGPTAATPSGHVARSVAVADLDGDGHLDVVVPYSGGLEIWSNDGRGRLSVTTSLDGPVGLPLVRAADVDGDGRDDLLTLGWDDEFPLEIRHQRAPGRFADPVRLEVPYGGWMSDILVGDLDGDGRPDLTVTGPRTVFATLLQRGDGWERFDHPNPTWIADAALGDVSGDGVDELVVQRGSVDVYSRGTGGGLAAPTSYGVGQSHGPVVIADVTHDGRNEIVVVDSHYERLHFLIQDGRGGLDLLPWVIEMPYASAALRGAEVLDVTGNGRRDLVLATEQHGLLLFAGY